MCYPCGTQKNSNHPTIKFTVEVLQLETTFLDTTVYKGERFEKESILEVRHIINTLKHFSTQITTDATQQAFMIRG